MKHNVTRMKRKKGSSNPSNRIVTAKQNNASPLLIHFQFILWKHFKELAIHSIPVSHFRRLLKQNYLE